MSLSPINRFPSGLKGIIVAGGDNNPDPQKLGRVKVFYPQIHGQNFDIEKAPWVQTQSSPNHTGPNSFDRPPQEGTIIHGDGITDSGHSYVSHVVSGKYQPQDISSNYDLTNVLPWFARARDIVPKFASGPINFSQTSEQNRTGKEKVTANEVPETPAKSIKQRDGTPTNGVAPSLIRKYIETKNIGTALQKAEEAMTQELASSLPGVPFNPATLLSSMPQSLMQQITRSVPSQALQALTNSLGLIGSYTPVSGTNFTNNAQNIDPNTFYPAAANVLMNIETMDDIEDAIANIINIVSDHAPSNTITIVLEGPNGNVNQKIFANGNVIIETSNSVAQTMLSFENFTTSITNADDGQNFLQNSDGPSEIIKKLIYRLPVSEQASLKQAIERKGKDIQKKLNDAAKSFFGGGATS